MIAFFDTNIHIALLRGSITVQSVLSLVKGGPVRLSPVVASELLRGSSGAGARAVEKLVQNLLPIEPPAWKQCWYEAGRLLHRVFRDHEEVGLARLQNDVLLALTSRHTGAPFVSYDAHFIALRKCVDFPLVTVTD
jgi:predicted nucleic acid-binding protein